MYDIIERCICLSTINTKRELVKMFDSSVRYLYYKKKKIVGKGEETVECSILSIINDTIKDHVIYITIRLYKVL